MRYLVEQITDLKAILHAKRANIYYLEKCRVMQKDGRVLYLTEAKAENQYWNIPIANTTCLLLGTGTSYPASGHRNARAGQCTSQASPHITRGCSRFLMLACARYIRPSP